MEFIFWDNPYLECETEDRIAAVYHGMMCEARPEYAEQHGDRAKEIALLTYELGYWGCGRIEVELAKLKGTDALPEPVRAKLSRVIRELTRYKDAAGQRRRSCRNADAVVDYGIRATWGIRSKNQNCAALCPLSYQNCLKGLTHNFAGIGSKETTPT